MASLINDVKDLVTSLLDGIKKVASIEVMSKERNIKERSDSSIMYFPVLMAKGTIDGTILDFLPRALDEQYVTLIHLALNTDDVINVDVSTKDAKEKYLQRFHNNIGVSKVRESYHLDMIKEYDYKSELNDRILNNHFMSEASRNRGNNRNNNNNNNNNDEEKPPLGIIGSITKDITGVSKAISGAGTLIKTGMDVYDRFQRHKNPTQNDLRARSSVGEVVEQRVKKINALTPSLFKMTVAYKSGSTIRDTEILIGCKTVIHTVESEEIIEYIYQSLKKNDLVFKLMKWTTGEIKFFRDLVLEVDDAKAEALGTRSSSRAIWNLLQRESSRNNIYKTLGLRQFIPNSTLIMSIIEADELKNRYGIDLMTGDSNSKKHMSKIFELFLFINVLVCDDVEEIVHIYDQKVEKFTPVSYRSLKSGEGSKELTEVLALALKK